MAKASTSVQEVLEYVTKIVEQLDRLKKNIPRTINKIQEAIKVLLNKLEGNTYMSKNKLHDLNNLTHSY